MHQKSDAALLECIEQVYGLYEQRVPFSAIDIQSEQGKCVLKVLNNHEFIAGGIRSGAFSETVYKQMQCSNVLKVYAASQGMIAELRHKDGKDTLFQDFEWLAKRWKADPLKRR